MAQQREEKKNMHNTCYSTMQGFSHHLM